jgi:probable HAF family extracellular repeat protein
MKSVLLRLPREVAELVLLCLLLFWIGRGALAQSSGYTVFQLPGAGDGFQVPTGLNSFGDVVGRAGHNIESSTRGTIWRQYSYNRTLLPAFFAGEYSSASSINDLDEIAGASNTDQALVPFVWTAARGMQRVPLLAGQNAGQALAINNHGQVVGYSSGAGGRRAFVWTRKTGVRDLGLLPGGNHSQARGVNDTGEIVGTAGSPAGNRAVFWSRDGSLHDLGTLPGDSSSAAMGINSAGDVAGYSMGASGMRAFLWTKARGMQALGMLPGGDSSRAFAINASRNVVGTATSRAGDRAFLWNAELGMKDLNEAIPAGQRLLLIEAHLINNRGQIVVMGRPADESPNHAPTAADEEVCAPAPPAVYLLTPSN